MSSRILELYQHLLGFTIYFMDLVDNKLPFRYLFTAWTDLFTEHTLVPGIT